MPVKFDTIKPGDVLIDARHPTGPARALHRWDVWEVRVISVDPIRRTAECSWNGNAPRTYYEHSFRSLRRSRPKGY